jgi:anti-sigma regulatory factor (Ser/Thr protein kinase)
MFYSEILPKSSSSPAQARRTIDRLSGELRDDTLSNARLMVSELVTNAVEHVHADGEIELHVDLQPELLRVEVVDPGEGFTPRPRGPDSRPDSGWGLHFISRLADRWAVEPGGRSLVWFELGRA